jgi:hypothetical protein
MRIARFVALILVLSGIGLVTPALAEEDPRGPLEEPDAARMSPNPAPVGDTVARLTKVTGMGQAVALCKPYMKDTVDAPSEGSLALGIWAAKHMKWANVSVARNETFFALAMKDSEEARGKRMCVSGTVAQITVERTEFGKFNTGLLVSPERDIYSFINVGSSGELVSNSPARMCGVITGRYQYANAVGGTSFALSIVGMFDLPQNR